LIQICHNVQHNATVFSQTQEIKKVMKIKRILKKDKVTQKSSLVNF